MKYFLTFVLFFSIALPAYASEVTGTLTTGVSTGNGVNGMVIEKPTADPVAGTYTSTQNVTLTGGSGTQSIHYTTDGSAATCTSGSTYSTPIVVDSNLVIEAISCYANSIDSGVILFGYTIDPPSGPAPSGGGGGGGGGGIVTTPSTSNLDFNIDGNIDVFDFNILMANWGTISGASTSTGDADGDGDVDILDFNLLIVNWQT